MAHGLILEFDGVGEAEYLAVNTALGINTQSGEGDWPPGLRYHAGGAKPGGWVVFELWDSQEDQHRFMDDRLGAALGAGGISGPPSRVEWLELSAALAL